MSRALTPILAGVGFSVFVYDDRPEFADIARFPGADGAAVVDFSDLKREVNVYARRLCGHRHRGHQADYGCSGRYSRRGRLPWHDWHRAKVSGHPGTAFATMGMIGGDRPRCARPSAFPSAPRTPEEIAVMHRGRDDSAPQSAALRAKARGPHGPRASYYATSSRSRPF